MFTGKEARWRELFRQIRILKMSLRPGRVQVLGDVISRPPHVMIVKLEVGNVDIWYFKINFQFGNYHPADQLFGHILGYLTGKEIKNYVLLRLRSILLPSFSLNDGRMYYKERIGVPRKLVLELLHLAHDCGVTGHFWFSETLARLSECHLKQYRKNLKSYCDVFLAIQQNIEGNQKCFNTPQPL